VRNAREYREKTKQLFAGHRELMHTLHVSSKEAVALMGQLSRDLGVEDFGAFSAEVGVLSQRAGLTRTEAASFIMKSSEMVRGTGYEMKGFALGAGRMLEDVRDMAKAGIISQEDLRQFGGAENIALNMARSAMNYASSPIGIVGHGALMAAQLGGGGVEGVAGMGIGEQLAATTGVVRTPMDLIRLVGGQRRFVDAMGPELLNAERAKMWLQQAQMVFGPKVGSEDFHDFLITQKLSEAEATAIVATRDRYGSDLPTLTDRNNAVVAERIRQMKEEGETPIGEAIRVAAADISGELWTPMTRRAEKMYTGIEQLMRVGGEAFGRFTYMMTGGAFAVKTTKIPGLELAFQLGGDFAKRHEISMDMNEEQAAEMNAQIVRDMGDSQLKVGRYREIKRTEEEMMQRGPPAGGAGILGYPGRSDKSVDYIPTSLRQVGIGTLSGKEAAIYAEDLIANIGRESFGIGEMFDPGSFMATAILGSAVAPLVATGTNILKWLGWESTSTGTLGKIAEGLGPGVTRERVQASLARMSHLLAGEYGELGEAARTKETRDEFVKRGLLKYTKSWEEIYGEEGTQQLEVLLAGLDKDAMSAIIGHGMALRPEEKENYDAERRRIAIEKLEKRGADTDDAAVTREMGTLKFADMKFFYLDVSTKQGQEREAADAKYEAIFSRSVVQKLQGFQGKNEAGGTTFDEASLRVTTDASSILMSEAIQRAIAPGKNYMRVYMIPADEVE
jgi:hypothetical protein